MKPYLSTVIFLIFSTVIHAQTYWSPQSGNASNIYNTSTGGNVGIGTNAPAQPLSVVGTAQFNGSGSQTIAYTRISWNAIGGTGASTFDNHRDLGNTAFVFRTTTGSNAFNELMRIDGSGNMGIGTTAPTSRLDVAGSLTLGAGSVNLNTTKLFLKNPYGKTWAISSGLNMVNEPNFGIYNWTDQGQASTPLPFLSISYGGNVGIGTANPQSLLAVKGTITAQKVVVTQTGWADYVFDSTYRLRPLVEVEQFVKEKRHLPEVPTTSEVESNGVDLGDNQTLLLKKIEELTLYLIEQTKEIEKQNQKIADLQDEQRQIKAQNKILQHRLVSASVEKESKTLKTPNSR